MSGGRSIETRSGVEPFFARWVLATFGGWLLGVLLIVLIAGVADLVGVGDQFAVGIGMGAGTGYVQWRVARRWFGATSGWMWASTLGLGAPFVFSDVAGVWRSGADMVLLVVNAAIGAFIAAIWQQRILRPHSGRANWWVPALVAGWVLAAVLPPAVILAGFPGPALELWRNLGAIALGGVVLGVVTGATLSWMLSPSQPAV